MPNGKGWSITGLEPGWWQDWQKREQPSWATGEYAKYPEAYGAAPTPVEEMPGGLILYSDGTYRDAWGIIAARSPEEARAYVEKMLALPPEEMSEYQEAQIELAQQRLAWEQARGGGAAATPEDTYAQYRQRMLYELTEPRDWITRWKLQHMPTRGRREVEHLEHGKLGPRYISRQRMGGASEQEAIDEALEGMQAWKNVREMTLGRPLTPEEEEQRERDYFEGMMQPLPSDDFPTEPPAPEWLPSFVPGLTAGQPIKKLPTKTPSGQQWGMTPWSVREGLAGYMDYAQYRPFIDMMEHAAMMQPAQPRGAGTERWRPSRQRA